MDPVKLALKKAEAYKKSKSKSEQEDREEDAGDEELQLPVKVALQKADDYKKKKGIVTDGVEEAKPSSVKTITFQKILGTQCTFDLTC